MNGEFVAWEDAKVHVLTHGLHYGTGVFEGVRCYETERGPAVFRNADHVERLLSSAELYYMEVPFSAEQLARRRSSWSRATAWAPATSARYLPRLRTDGPQPARGAGRRDDRLLGVGRVPGRGGQAGRHPRKGLFLGADQRPLAVPHAKASGQYLNSILAKVESLKAGYEEAILLDEHGHVCEGTGENVYVVRDGEIATPGQHNSILDGITRRSLIQIARTRLQGRRAQHRPRRDVPRRGGLPLRTAAESCPCARSTTTRSAPGSPARSRACCSRPSTT